MLAVEINRTVYQSLINIFNKVGPNAYYNFYKIGEIILFYYLWADLVAALSNLQMYNFTHDGLSYSTQSSQGSLITYSSITGLLYCIRNDVICDVRESPPVAKYTLWAHKTLHNIMTTEWIFRSWSWPSFYAL